MDELKDRLRRLKRRDRRIAKDIANTCGVSSQTVFKWLKGSMPKSHNLVQLSAMFNVTPDYLAHGDADKARAKAMSKLREEVTALSPRQITFLAQVAREISHRG
jgi:transcriptional regulator with XRE-family HTH domain